MRSTLSSRYLQASQPKHTNTSSTRSFIASSLVKRRPYTSFTGTRHQFSPCTTAKSTDLASTRTGKSLIALRQHRNARSASSTSVALEKKDDYNPPRSTLPPDVPKVERGDDKLFAYLWKLARTYGTFYKTGGKAIFTNRTLAVEARERLRKLAATKTAYDRFDQQLLAAAIEANVITRSEYQLLKRHGYDFARLPIFGVLILILGEWLPLFVPFIPYAVPLTCRIPNQLEGMRKKVEDRRKMVFRQGIEPPTKEQLEQIPVEAGDADKESKAWPLLDLSRTQQSLQTLRSEQLWYLSCVLNLHSRMWETLQQRPPSWLMRLRLARKLQYLAQDDLLLMRGSNGAAVLAPDELMIACEERGLDVLGPSPKVLQQQLAGWLRRQKDDEGRGRAVLHMLFRRPNSW